MSTVSINGNVISFDGSVTIKNNKVYINGKDTTPEAKEISIIVNGDVNKIEADACNTISVSGNSGDIKTMSGNVIISGNANGSISTMSGDVQCGAVSGSVKSMSGDIKIKNSTQC